MFKWVSVFIKELLSASSSDEYRDTNFAGDAMNAHGVKYNNKGMRVGQLLDTPQEPSAPIDPAVQAQIGEAEADHVCDIKGLQKGSYSSLTFSDAGPIVPATYEEFFVVTGTRAEPTWKKYVVRREPMEDTEKEEAPVIEVSAWRSSSGSLHLTREQAVRYDLLAIVDPISHSRTPPVDLIIKNRKKIIELLQILESE